MFNDAGSLQFAKQWIAAWNRRDVEEVLGHFHDEAVFVSPVAQQIGFDSHGIVNGKPALRRYWISALKVNPDIHFELADVYRGIDTIVIAYRNQRSQRRLESLRFENGLIVRGRAMSVVTEA